MQNSNRVAAKIALRRPRQPLRRSTQRERKLPAGRVPLFERLEDRLLLATVELTPSKDTTLIEIPAGNSNGAGPFLQSGRVSSNQSNSIRRAAIAFNTSGIPAGATVTAANLSVHVSRDRGGAQSHSLHKLLADWGEGASTGNGRGTPATTGSATWTHRMHPNTAWTSPGGDFVATPTATAAVTGRVRTTWTSNQLLTDVQEWVNNPATNFGWLLLGNESTPVTVTRFTSKDNSRFPNPPRLTITYSEPANLTLSIAAGSFSEAAGAAATTATVTRAGSTSGPLVVNLTSTDLSELTVPSTVTIPAGQATSPTFSLDAVDDVLVDGTQTVAVTADAPGFVTASDTVDVTDDDVASLSLTIAAESISEAAGAGATTATVSRNTPTSSPLVVTLISSDTSEATLPALVTIPAGQTISPAFNVDAVDDAIVDGPQTVTITANSSGFVPGTDTLEVTDDDGPPPRALAADINGADNPNRSLVASLVLRFDQAVTVSSANSLNIFNHTSGSPLNLSAAVLQNNGTNEVTWNMSTVHFPDGYYTAELRATEATNAKGQPLAATHAFSFHILVGDGTGDTSVDFLDFAQLSSNFGGTVGPLGPGDLDGSGTVNFGDFAVLSARFGVTLGPAPDLDFGDAPETDTSYPTTLENDAARHTLGSDLYLGASVDGEPDGQPGIAATGDDELTSDDEDGVTFAGLQAGTTASIIITAKVPSEQTAMLNAWMDFNADGDWDDDGEQVFVDQPVTDGVNNLGLSIPATATAGVAFTRFRLTSTPGYTYRGLAADGEVEDYAVTITAASSSLSAVQAPRRASSSRGELTVQTSPFVAGHSASLSVHPPAPFAAVDQAIRHLTADLRTTRTAADRLSSLDEYLIDDVIAEEASWLDGHPAR